MLESPAEHSALRLMDHKYGDASMRRLLKTALDGDLRGRRGAMRHEPSLALVQNQGEDERVPYPDTRGLVEALRKQIPPDLPYRITDMFATIMLNDNKAVSAKVQPTSDCKYKGGDLGGRYEEDARQR